MHTQREGRDKVNDEGMRLIRRVLERLQNESQSAFLPRRATNHVLVRGRALTRDGRFAYQLAEALVFNGEHRPGLTGATRKRLDQAARALGDDAYRAAREHSLRMRESDRLSRDVLPRGSHVAPFLSTDGRLLLVTIDERSRLERTYELDVGERDIGGAYLWRERGVYYAPWYIGDVEATGNGGRMLAAIDGKSRVVATIEIERFDLLSFALARQDLTAVLEAHEEAQPSEYCDGEDDDDEDDDDGESWKRGTPKPITSA